MNKYESPTLTIGEAAKMLGVHIDTVRNWEKRGYVTSVKTPGGHRRFNTDEIRAISGRTLMSTTYEKEEEAVVKKWEKTGILKHLNSRKGPVAVIMENQRLFNEAMTDTGDVAQFKRISIPLVRRWFGELRAFDLVSVQPMLGPTALIHFFKKNKIVTDTVCAETKKMKCVWSYEAQQDLRSCHNLDAEAELTAVMAMELMLETDRQIMTDLRNGAAIKRTINFDFLHGEYSDKAETVRQQTIKTANELCELYGRPMPNWMVTSRELAQEVFKPTEVPETDIFSGNLVMEDAGVWKYDDENEIKVYTDPLFPQGSIVLGYKGEHAFDCGYVYAPYCPLQLTPVVLDPDSFTPRRGIMTRFATKMVNPTYYATLHVDQFKTVEEIVEAAKKEEK